MCYLPSLSLIKKKTKNKQTETKMKTNIETFVNAA